MICCDKCEMWSHCVCYQISQVAVPDTFFCRVCKVVQPSSTSLSAPSVVVPTVAPPVAAPRPVPVAEEATRGQKREREEEAQVDAAALMSSFGGH
jgi:hypothetical protein